VFTGLVEACVAVRRAERRDRGLRLWLAAPGPDWRVGVGDSIAVSGACLSVAASADPRTGELLDRSIAGADIVFDLSAETLERTWLGESKAGTLVNIERPLALGDRLDGHLVSGHVDGLGRIAALEDSRDGGRVMSVEVERGLERYLIEKGSVTLDGVSLTVVSPSDARFAVALIPITLEKTSFGSAAVGQRVNVEADLVGKWIEKLLPR
jgi:riboflavin synthase